MKYMIIGAIGVLLCVGAIELRQMGKKSKSEMKLLSHADRERRREMFEERRKYRKETT